jgi:hypothetical protein
MTMAMRCQLFEEHQKGLQFVITFLQIQKRHIQILTKLREKEKEKEKMEEREETCTIHCCKVVGICFCVKSFDIKIQ